MTAYPAMAQQILSLIDGGGGARWVLFLLEVEFLDLPIRHRTINKVIVCLSLLEVGWFDQPRNFGGDQQVVQA